MPVRTRRKQVFIFEGEAKSVLAASESFARRGFHVVVGSSKRYCFGFHTRFTRERVLIPNQLTDPDACGDFVLDLTRRRRFDMVLPLGDECTELVCRRRDEFLKLTRLVLVPYETFTICRDKTRTMAAAARCGVPIPKTWTTDDRRLDEIAGEVEYPVLVKPAVSNGARGIAYACNAADLKRRFAETEANYGRTFVQELIPHEGMQYKTELLLDRDSKLLAGFAYKKIRFYPPNGGSSTLNESVEHPELVDLAARLARSIGWFGMCDFDWIHDVRDNRPKLMEVNPRVTDTIQIAQFAGIDFFAMLYDVACGREVRPVTRYRTGFYMRFLPGDLLWFLTSGPKRFRTQPGFFHFFGGDTKYLTMSWRDPGPFIAYLAENCRALLNRREREYRFRLQSVRPGSVATAQ